MGWLTDWLSSNGLVPHGFCYQWKPGLIWLHVVSDLLIALAYFSMPIALVHLVRKRRDLPFSWLFVCFGVFIAACGATHLMEVWTLWVPSYWLSGTVKATTALASIPTAVALVRLMPEALKLPSHRQLEAANEELRQQTARLKESEQRFRLMAENIREIFWTVDPQTKEAKYVSPAFEQICERPVESVYSHPISYREIIHPEDRQRVLDALGEVATTERLDEEFRIVCPSGAVKWLRAMGFPAKDSKGTVQALVGTAQEITERKEIEAALRKSEDLFRDLVEHSSDLICTHDLQGRMLSVNELPVKLLGYTRDELLNRPMREFLPPEARDEFDAGVERIGREGSAKGLMVVLTKTGERRVWEYHNTLRTDGVSGPIVRGIAHDVTEQKKAERALRLSEEKFSKAFLASPYAIAISTIEEGRLLEINDSFRRILGYSRDEAVGRTSTELGLWVCPNERGEILEEIRATGRVRSRQVRFQRKEGKHVVVNYSGEVIELEGRGRLLSICEDITERMLAEERVREYEKAVESVDEMIVIVDRNYRYLLANRVFLTTRGLQREQVIGRQVAEVIGEEFFERVARPSLDQALAGNVVRFEAQHNYPNIGARDVFVSLFPIEGTAGIDRVVCVLRDITERKRAEEELRRLSGQLLRMQDEERRKIARDLHDATGQDLVALATTLSQLHGLLPAAKRKWRRLISECEATATGCLRDVRTLSYLLHPPMLDEAGLEDAIRHFAGGFADRTGIAVDLEVASSFGRLPQEVELGLFRVVQESLVNIQRHSGSATAKIELIREPSAAKLSVSDRGRGIAASRRRKNGSIVVQIGVGIPSMEERVKQVGGRLEIESNERGTSVRVTVPIHA